MGCVAQGVEDEVVEAFEQGCRGRGQGTEIGEVCGAFEAEAEDLKIAMEQRHGNDGYAEQFERTVDDVEVDTGHGAERGRFIEDVSEGATQNLEGFFGAVYRDGAFLAN